VCIVGDEMSIDQITAEQEAMESMIKLLEQAKRCQMLYERAHMSFPEPLKRVLGQSGNGAGAAPIQETLNIPEPTRPPMPDGAKSDWIWVKQEDATVTSVALALLRAANAPVRPRDLITEVMNILPDANRGSVNNIGTKFGGGLIDRTDDGWRITNPEKAGIFSGGYLWAPKEVFQQFELAAHRRDAIVHVLRNFPGGLQLRQILEQLKRCAWMRAPLNKHLLKADLNVLDEQKKIRRVGNSGKWGLAPMKLDT
jgi:hypothetical protein